MNFMVLADKTNTIHQPVLLWDRIQSTLLSVMYLFFKSRVGSQEIEVKNLYVKSCWWPELVDELQQVVVIRGDKQQRAGKLVFSQPQVRHNFLCGVCAGCQPQEECTEREHSGKCDTRFLALIIIWTVAVSYTQLFNSYTRIECNDLALQHWCLHLLHTLFKVRPRRWSGLVSNLVILHTCKCIFALKVYISWGKQFWTKVSLLLSRSHRESVLVETSTWSMKYKWEAIIWPRILANR